MVCEECFYNSNGINYLGGADYFPNKKLENVVKDENFREKMQISLKNMKVNRKSIILSFFLKNQKFIKNLFQSIISLEIN